VENMPPHVLRGVSKEVIALSQEPPEGIKIFINHDDITDVQASIVGPGNYIVSVNIFVLYVFVSFYKVVKLLLQRERHMLVVNLS